ncbi:type II toxin-antitoxin system RelE/ParE family toxin [Jiella endophytica]|uniref:Type II toxin-antitoxin system RelE/ParE family toxin n=1 Tax=Jiella endophytica TaxID=2558362 RepID=A0A4Y8RH17_9HYPH|nr:type II toxin-antitoxin system RelE/ParE family toxin [Jiella endophytica]TFF21716.1 type II toxin-antitoxin system RelE/ParE family toxin [Jiella endophytica]
MPRLRYLPSAKADLVEILGYVTRQSGSLLVGRRFVALLRQKCASLAALPGLIGTPRPELRPDIRSFAFRGYVIFFRYLDDRATFEVVDILEGHLDIEALFSGGVGQE